MGKILALSVAKHLETKRRGQRPQGAQTKRV